MFVNAFPLFRTTLLSTSGNPCRFYPEEEGETFSGCARKEMRRRAEDGLSCYSPLTREEGEKLISVKAFFAAVVADAVAVVVSAIDAVAVAVVVIVVAVFGLGATVTSVVVERTFMC